MFEITRATAEPPPMRPIPGYEGDYAVTDDGRVWSARKTTGDALQWDARFGAGTAPHWGSSAPPRSPKASELASNRT